MIKAYKRQLIYNLRYFRKIHIYHAIWLVSLYSKQMQKGIGLRGKIRNILRFPLSFVFIPVRVVDWREGMGKSILVIDTPNACIDCPCHFAEDTGKVWCGKDKKEFLTDDIETFKPDWCPLREAPKCLY